MVQIRDVRKVGTRAAHPTSLALKYAAQLAATPRCHAHVRVMYASAAAPHAAAAKLYHPLNRPRRSSWSHSAIQLAARCGASHVRVGCSTAHSCCLLSRRSSWSQRARAALLSACLSACLPACLSAGLSACLSVCLVLEVATPSYASKVLHLKDATPRSCSRRARSPRGR